ncbi:MAG: NAD-binding protein [Haloferacaceae archaeon]
MTESKNMVIAGGGRVGFRTAEILDDRGHDVLLIEHDEEVCERIADEYVSTVVEGDASDPDILEQANVEDADVIAALTGETGLNLAICMAADRMADDIRTVSRVHRATETGYERFVDATVFPEHAGAQVAADEMLGADVETIARGIHNLDILRIRVGEDAPAAGRELSDVRFPEGTLLISNDKGEGVSQSDTVLTPGQRYLVAVEPAVVDEVLNLLRG